ncbi:MAG: hypothetical protein AAB276_00960, partial [Pseudomonadota bacterium]
THKLLHGISGAGVGFITGEDPLSRGMGAMVGEVMAETFGAVVGEAALQDPRIIEQGIAVAEIGAIFANAGLGLDPRAGANGAEIAARHNCFWLIPPAVEAAVVFATTLAATPAGQRVIHWLLTQAPRTLSPNISQHFGNNF